VVGLSVDHDYIDHLISIKRKYSSKCLIAYLNINSYRYKHKQLDHVFKNILIDVFAIAETKLDDTHFSPQFEKPNYKMFRRDRPVRGTYGGGVIVYVNKNISCNRKKEYECINYDLGMRKWLCIFIYRSTSDSLSRFLIELESALNKAICKHEDVIIMSDYVQNAAETKI
jgi:exonuclease III